MMQFNPTLKLHRLVVNRSKQAVYDEAFHSGVNILRGDNSSGKSTILNFIFYGLGGDLADWSDVALECSRVTVEVSFNGMMATLSREISSSPGRPMDVYGGSYEASQAAATGEWNRYPYRRSDTIESFSQALFRLLDIPEVTNDQTGNLTVHQILRLLYADQLSPVEQLFKFEPFDPPTLRDTVGRLLCGAYDGEVYNNEVKLKELIRQFDQVNAQLKSLFVVLGRTDQAQTLEWIEGQRLVLEEQRVALQGDLEDAERRLFTSNADDELTLKAQNEAYSEVQNIQNELAVAKAERDELALTIADSDAFIANLRRREAALADSDTVAKHLGNIRFRACPACYAAIEGEEEDHSCHLCKTPFEKGPAHTRIVSLINETGRQLKQSLLLQRRRRSGIDDLDERLGILNEEWARASRKLANLQRLPSSESRALIRSLNRQAGYLDRQLEDLDGKRALAQEISELSARKETLNAEITRLRTRNEQLRASQSKRLGTAYVEIEREIIGLLHSDLPRQDAFVTAKHVEFDFGANNIGVDGQTYFSASSRVILKSSFFAGFLLAAARDKSFRHPRFCMLDTIEDKGMEEKRSHNFQRLLVERSRGCNVDHQIIFATAMIAPELDVPELVVGGHSTLANPTIRIGRSASASKLL